jgi:hypothetical protein
MFYSCVLAGIPTCCTAESFVSQLRLVILCRVWLLRYVCVVAPSPPSTRLDIGCVSTRHHSVTEPSLKGLVRSHASDVYVLVGLFILRPSTTVLLEGVLVMILIFMS